MNIQNKPHIAVLQKEINFLINNIIQKFLETNTNQNFTAIDFTFGAGGHSEIILNNLQNLQNYQLISLDRDPSTQIFSTPLLNTYKNFVYFNDISYNMTKYININHKVYFILGDLGLSQIQLNNQRGFAYKDNSILDMQMGIDSIGSLHQHLKSLSEFEIGNILREYGEELHWKKIAKEIAAHKKKINTTDDLKNLIKNIISPKYVNKSLSRCFQAFRIFINQELTILEKTLKTAYDILEPNGCLAIITFHSLEDRLVKTFFKHFFKKQELIYPSSEEIVINSQSRSSKLRIGTIKV